ncbi:hypothetical protein P152DRAFT_116268 [Eremomyces bilateralis CBS 781.70]|uniref:Pentatricopeptide repeat domain-containing protein n=1 Tax=Eremomyces bilateralis CBS 781.70 TaxID=1392243 RepID=A0A6G1GEE0_9PEZI|nr:uncharacterized protein P152DRAFT_116268 [Eremomyces bilateralis CBS 781.70]KAF1816261.1 hypothetical protein P152DRAFT_116268 [Eremomyces bilateralis CBS 781.70]
MKPRWALIRSSVRRPPSNAHRATIHASQIISFTRESPPITQAQFSTSEARLSSDAAHHAVHHLEHYANPQPNCETARFTPIRRVKMDSEASAVQIPSRRPPNYRPEHDFGTWVLALQDRQLSHGRQGVIEVWRKLCSHGLYLPEGGDDAPYLWNCFIANPELVDEVFQHAAERKRKGHLNYRKLYSQIVTHAIRDPAQFGDPVHWHHRLARHGLASTQDFQTMARYAVSKPESLQSLKRIFLRLNDRKYQGLVLDALGNQGRMTLALEWQAMLKGNDSRQNNPSIRYYVQDIQSETVAKETKIQTQSQDEGTMPHSAPSRLPKLTLRNKTDEGVTLTDDLLSRILATRAFSLNVILKGLSMLSLPLIGTSALRAIALRSGDSQTFMEYLTELAEANVAIEASHYTHMILNLATSGREEELQAVLNSDQHPSNFDDIGLQEHLLRQCLSRGDLESARPVLTFLTLNSQHPSLEAWNMVLKQYAVNRDVVRIHQTLERMEAEGIHIHRSSLTMLCQYCLRWRRGRHPPPALPGRRAGGPEDDMEPLTSNRRPFTRDEEAFALVGIWKKLITSGYSISPLRWHEPLRRLGHLGHFEELSKLCGWLADWYAPRPTSNSKGWRGSQREKVKARALLTMSDPRHPLRRLFSESFQKAVITWGIQDGIRRVLTWNGRAMAYKNGRYTISVESGSPNGPAKSAGHETPQYVDWVLISEMEAQRRKGMEQDMIQEVIQRPDPSVFTGGLKVLTDLQQHRGVVVNTVEIRRGVNTSLWRIFGIGRRSRRLNFRFKILNAYKLEEIVLEMEKAWGARGPGLWPRLMTRSEAHDRYVSGQVQGLSLIQQLVESKNPESTSKGSVMLEPDEILHRRMRMAFVLFGPKPAILVGSRARGLQRKIPHDTWTKLVERWAVRGEGTFDAYGAFTLPSSE